MNAGFAGKVALVTGGATGLGEGMCRAFAASGAKVVIGDIDLVRADALAQSIGAQACRIDVSDAASVRQADDEIERAYGRIDILVNNAGTAHPAVPLEQLEEHGFDRLLAINMRSIYLTARYFVPRMKQRGEGVILNIASAAGLRPRPGLAWYSASKGWVITATKAMAAELAADGIRVNAICPAAADTRLFRDLLSGDKDAMRESIAATIPLGRMVTPDDIAAAACYLCGPAAALVTGVALEVDGGRCI